MPDSKDRSRRLRKCGDGARKAQAGGIGSGRWPPDRLAGPPPTDPDLVSETAGIVSPLIKALNRRPDIVVWRNNVGAMRGGRVRFGKPGQGDIDGLIRLSGPLGIRLEIECKKPKGKLSDSQRRHGKMLVDFGAIYIVTTSVGDCLDRLDLEIAELKKRAGAFRTL